MMGRIKKTEQKRNRAGFWVAYAMECIASAALGVQASNKLFAKPSNLETRTAVVSYGPNVPAPGPNQPRLVIEPNEPIYTDANDVPEPNLPVEPNTPKPDYDNELKTEIKDGKLLYIIQKGDVFEKIEVKGNLVRGLIQKLNPKVNSRKLQVGQKIVVGYEGKPDFGKKRNLFPEDKDYVFLARMLFGEARGCSEFEKAQLAYSAINKINDKIDWNGRTLREVLNCEEMYDCFDSNDINWPLVNNPDKHDKKSWGECLRVAKGVLNKEYEDKTQRATHYYNPETSDPYWAHNNEFTNIGRIQESKDKQTKHAFCKKN